MTDVARLRRGVFAVYAIAALLQFGVLAAAMLRAPAALLSRLFFGQFLFLILGGLAYLASSFAASGVFHYEALSDFLVGVAGYVVVLTFCALAGPWLAPAPGLFLLGYGLFVKRKTS